MSINPRDRLIVPLDVPSVTDARAIIADLGDAVSFYKIGYQLGYAGGFSLAQELIKEGMDVFMDLKLLDIDNTVQKGVESICQLGATFLTIHAYPKAMRAAVAGRGENRLRLLGVTVLTSMDDEDLDEAGYAKGADALVADRAADARLAGMDGIVCSALEATRMRSVVGPDMAIVTPGIRPQGSNADDQKRIMTPKRAILAGADYLVTGRPITAVANRADVARAILDEMAEAFESRSQG